MQEQDNSADRFRKWGQERLSDALYALADDGADLEVLGNVELALMSLSMYYDSDAAAITLTPSDVVEYVDEPDPECICPPGLVARGGFRGGCPVHG